MREQVISLVTHRTNQKGFSMIYKISRHTDSQMQECYDRAMGELRTFFGLNWSIKPPKVFIVNNREDIDDLYGKKTEGWFVAWAERRMVFLLEKENFEKESTHNYSEEGYLRLLKHELSHLFYQSIAGTDKPRWLNEGVSVYLSGQLVESPKVTTFTKFLDHFDTGGAYLECGTAVKFLVETYGKEKLVELLKELHAGEVKPESFRNTFVKIYGFIPEYCQFISRWESKIPK